MKNVHISNRPLILHKLTLLRDKETGPKKFRQLISEIAILIAYEATQDLRVKPKPVKTPLAIANGYELMDKIGLVPVLRAGLGMVEGIWEMMPNAEVWHIGLYRDERTLHPVAYYNRLPVEPTVQACLVLDPMLATGGSAVEVVNMLKKWGARHIKFLGIIAAPEGVEFLSKEHPDVPIHLAAIDDHLTPPPQKAGDPPAGFIVPGLGDAGDRQFGTG